MTGNKRDASDCLTASPRTQEDACYQMLNNTYKFYLALENSVCQDYVTEKFFNILQYNVIPGLDKLSSQISLHVLIPQFRTGLTLFFNTT